jgi:5-methyltetrahydrofolate--homocysteine methyltransferase
MDNMQDIIDCIVKGKTDSIETAIKRALGDRISINDIVNNGFVKSMEQVANLWKSGEYFIPDVIVAAKVMQIGMNVIRPFTTDGSLKPKAAFAIGTVKGDLHDIGKNIVALMLEGAGYKVINLGIDVDPEKFLKCAQEDPEVRAVGLSALLTTTMPQMAKTVELIRKANLSGKVKIFIGGAPVTQAFANEIGADYYSADAVHAVEQVNSLFT